MDNGMERVRAEAEATRQELELARQSAERARVVAEDTRVRAEEGRQAASNEVARTVATLTELLGRMEVVEQMRRVSRGERDNGPS
jgi:hypothetical protein